MPAALCAQADFVRRRRDDGDLRGFKACLQNLPQLPGIHLLSQRLRLGNQGVHGLVNLPLIAALGQKSQPLQL